MKRWNILVAATLATVLAGCQTIQPQRREGTVSIPEQFAVQTFIRYGELEMNGEYRRSPSGESSLQLSAPDNLDGLTLTLSDGELTADYGELSFTVDGDAEPEHAVMRVLSNTLENLGGRSFQVPSGAEPYLLTLQNELGRMQAVVTSADGLNFVPKQVSVDSLQFSASFVPLPV